MAEYEVTLYTEEKAVLKVSAPDGASEETLTALALEALDDSGGAEWVTTFADTRTRQVDAGEEH